MADDFMAPEETRNESKFRTLSRKLDRLRRDNYCDLLTEISATFPKLSDLKLRPLPVVSKYAKTVAAQYVRRPRRDFGVEAAGLSALSAEIEIDESLREMNERLACQNSQITVVVAGDDGVPRVRHFNPCDVIDDLRDPDHRNFAKAAEEVRVRVPLRKDSDGTSHFGVWVLSDTHAYEERPNGDRVSLFRPNEPSDLTNPLGRIPVVGVRTIDAPPGHWIPDPPEDLWHIGVGASLTISDILHTGHWQHYAERVLTGPGAEKAAKKMFTGKDGVVAFGGPTAAEGTLTYQLLTAKPDTEGYMRSLEVLLRYWAAMRFISAEPLGVSSGITGDAKRQEQAEQEVERKRRENSLVSYERRLWRLLVDVWNLDRLNTQLPQPTLEITWHYVEARQNGLQELQGLNLAAALGLDSASERIAKEEGIPIEKARERHVERLDEFVATRNRLRDAGVDPKAIPGVDKAAGAM